MTTAMPETLNLIADVMREYFQLPEQMIDRQTTAKDVSGWDSLAHTMLIMRIEEAFDVTLPDERIFDLQNVGELADLVQESINGQRR